MIILLDENFPLRFYTRLQKEGFSGEHILLTHRGIHDRDIFIRLRQEELLFLTQDEDSWMPHQTARRDHLVACVAIYGDRSTS
jgi:predicted nuclease of predicted toxin-antitoxin system